MSSVIFTLKNYLTHLHQMESVEPSGRHIPTHAELAEKCGMSTVSFSRMVNNERDAIPRAALAVIMRELRSYGFEVTFDDLLQFIG